MATIMMIFLRINLSNVVQFKFRWVNYIRDEKRSAPCISLTLTPCLGRLPATVTVSDYDHVLTQV